MTAGFTRKFAKLVLEVDTAPGEGGTPLGTLDPAAGVHWVPLDEPVTITAVPSGDWVFSRWQHGAWGIANPLTVLVDVETHILAEFVERPGLGDLDMLGDLAYFLSAIGSAETIDTFDRNAITYDEDLERVYTGNGIPDAAELFLLQEVLLRPGLDLSHRGGVVHYFAWPAWTANVARAAVDLPGADARIRRVVAGCWRFVGVEVPYSDAWGTGFWGLIRDRALRPGGVAGPRGPASPL